MVLSGKEVTKISLFASLVVIAIYLVRVPAFDGRVYFHLGDAVIVTAAFLMKPRQSAFVAGLGSALADVLLGSVVWAPLSFIIHGAQGWLISKMADGKGGTRDIIAITAGAAVMIAGYTVCAGVLYGAAVMPIEFFGDLLQSGIGGVAGFFFAKALKRFPSISER